MARAGGYEDKRRLLANALKTLAQSLALDLNRFGEIEKDTIKSGQVQKFEICVELFWKTLQKFLSEIHGIETASPKTAVKAFFTVGYLDAVQYEKTIEMINDRNRLSHIYSEKQFNEIYRLVADYLQLMQKAMGQIQ